jgi:hypothetical protein
LPRRGTDRRRAGDPARRVLDSARRDQTMTTAGEPARPMPTVRSALTLLGRHWR